VLTVAGGGREHYDGLVADGPPLGTLFGALLFSFVGFVGGAMGSAWWTRSQRTEPWRELQVDHEGLDGAPSRTRIIFEDRDLPLQDVEVRRRADGQPISARFALEDGGQVQMRFDDGQPSEVTGGDGDRATITWSGTRATVTFRGQDGKTTEEKVLVPVELRPSLSLATTTPAGDGVLAGLSLIGEARAQTPSPSASAEEEDLPIAVEREVTVELGLRASASDKEPEGEVRLEARCAPPLSCVVRTPEVSMPAMVDVQIAVAGSVEKSELGASGELSGFTEEAREERKYAQRRLDDVAAAVAGIGVVAMACDEAGVESSVCVAKMGRRGNYLSRAGAAVEAIRDHEVDVSRGLEQRAARLRDQDAARKQLDRGVSIELCATRPGYSRACTKIEGRPLAADPMATEKRTLDLRRGLGGTLVGSYVLTQADGNDCKFSPSPKTSGPLNLSFDEKKGVMTATFSAKQSGTRPGLRCSLGTANMRWEQTYSATATQSLSPAQLASGGKISLRLNGNMAGTGNYTFSGCRSSGGAAANCPGGRREPYNYPIEINGSLDLSNRTGRGNIVVTGAPLSTRGSWQLPAAKGTP